MIKKWDKHQKPESDITGHTEANAGQINATYMQKKSNQYMKTNQTAEL